jgi:hypothetical protein
MVMRKILMIVVLFIVIGNLQAQTKNRLPCIDKKFSIVVHVVKDSLKNYGVFAPTLPATFTVQIQRTIDSLNAHFAPICVSFEVCEYRYIENYWYLNEDVNYLNKFEEMRVLYNADNRINIYYVQSINNGDSYYVQGLITNGNNVSSNGILLNNTMYRNMLLSMGLYFGLSTTFEPAGELVNGSNAPFAGDKIKDTPADPYVRGDALSNYVDINCKFISMKKDDKRQYYSPIVGNAMSYYPNNCLCNSPYAFTHDQYEKMAITYLSNPAAW